MDNMNLSILFVTGILIVTVKAASIEKDTNYQVAINNTFEVGKVYKGDPVKPHAYPFIIGLLYESGNLKCGGSLLTTKHVLTAAHCIVNLNSSAKYIAIAGMHEINPTNGPNEPGRQIAEFTKSSAKIHPRYDPENLSNDVAVITLKNEFKISDTVKTICIAPSQNKATVAGWGVPDCGRSTSNVLLKATGTVRSNADCVKDDDSIGPGKLCMLFDDQSSNSGDSGGPLFHKLTNGKFQQIGITSYGYKDQNECPDLSRPVVFARANEFKKFIPDAVNGRKVFC